jgi:hypothetical protein
MASLLNVSIDVTKLPKEKFVKGKNGAVYYDFTISVNDTPNEWGKNVSLFDSQTKEERDAKKKKDYLGSGKVTWTDGKVEAVAKQQAMGNSQPQLVSVDDSGLPF